MSSKPDWCPEDIWESATEVGLLGYLPEHLVEAIAKSALQARSQAFEEASKIADDMSGNWGDREFYAVQEVSQAIRQHSQKGKDK